MNALLSLRKFAASIWRAADEATINLRMQTRKNCSYQPLSGRRDGIVVSLTSFPARMGVVWITLDSMFRQKTRPDKIVLYLTDAEFPGGLAEVPQQVKRLAAFGLEIRFVPDNLYCHNKYFYALREFPDATVITVDDDSYYRSDTIGRLMEMNRKYPSAVCCNIASVINMDSFYDYSTWKKASAPHAPNDLCVANGFSGVLYPPHVIGPGMFDKELLLKLAPKADDLWLKANEVVMGVKVATGSYYPRPVTVGGSQKISLRKYNKGPENGNRLQWKALDAHFGLREKIEK